MPRKADLPMTLPLMTGRSLLAPSPLLSTPVVALNGRDDASCVSVPAVMLHAGIIDQPTIDQVHLEATEEAESALEQALGEPRPTPEDINRFTYAPSPVDPVYPEDYTGLPS